MSQARNETWAGNQVRTVVLVAFPGVQSLDLTGPSEVFSLATRAGAQPGYALELVTADGRPFETSSGLTLTPTRALDGRRGPIDTLVVAGGQGVAGAMRDEALRDWLGSTARESRRVASVCTGAFLLAAAGLLDGRRATTHWEACDELARRFPSVSVDPDPIFVRDGHIYTSAGVTAGIDLALALVEEDCGRRRALEVARSMVVYMRRSGRQAQVSSGLAGQGSEPAGMRELLDWLPDHLDEALSVPSLAARAFMSERHFARVFAREVGVSPGAYVSRLRLERAQMLLDTTALQLQEIAARCGFGTVETLRRAYGRAYGHSPRTDTDANVLPLRRESAA
jgi:transcriptional regulator GlxA family with amidase domain